MNGAVLKGGEERRGTDSARLPPHCAARRCRLAALGFALLAPLPLAAESLVDPELEAYVARHFEAVHRMQEAAVSLPQRRPPVLLVVEQEPQRTLRLATALATDEFQRRADRYVLRQIAASAWSDISLPGHARPQP